MPKFAVVRSNVINASPSDVFASVRDFKQWTPWSPWLLSEPDCPVNVAEDGLSYSWEGKIVGSGEMAIVAEEAGSSISYRLTFLTPWKSVSAVRFDFAEKDGGTEVTWAMDSSLPFFMFWMKSMMQAWIGMDYQRGLMMLKDHVETGEVPSKLEFVGQSRFPGAKYVGIRTTCGLDDVGPAMERDFGALASWASDSGTELAGKPFSIYHKYDMVKGTTEYTAGIPLEFVPVELGEGMVSGELAACPAYAVRHTGPYRHLGNAWSAGMMRGRSKVFRQNKRVDPFEIYENDPAEVAEKDLITTVYFPTK